MDQVLCIECGIPFSLSHQMLFVNNDLMQRLTGCVAFLGDSGALLVAEMRLQECNDTDGVHDVVFAAFGVGGNAFNQFLTQCVAGVADGQSRPRQGAL